MKNLSFVLIFALISSCSSEAPNPTAETEKPKNIILMIGDGMGLSQVSAAFYFQEAASNFNRFGTVGLIKTSSSSDKITDSAAGATAFSTGKKTYNGAIAMDTDTAKLPTIVEILSQQNFKSGVIATSSITHATPASFYAHVRYRSMAEEIAAQLIQSEIDFFAGGGKEYFMNRADNRDLMQEAVDNGFVIDTVMAGKSLDQNKKYGYLMADDGMPPILQGRGDFLQDASAMALNYLPSDEGFFLMIEGSQIDWGGHANNADYLISEMIDFDKVIGQVLDFAEKDGNTLVVVTADHETGGFTLSGNEGDYNDVIGTFSTGGHSTTLVPVFAFGPGSQHFGGIYENTSIFDKMINALK
jgi:alkaline phosphatase